MKTLIVVSSTYLGNTTKIAESMAKALKGKIQSPAEALVSDLSTYDLIGLGSNIAFAAHSKEIIAFAESAPLQGKKVFIFSTRCRPFLGKYHQKLKKLLVARGASLLGEFSCPGFDRTGPWIGLNGYNKGRPNSKDLFKAALFALKMRKQAHPLCDFIKMQPATAEFKGLAARKNGAGEVMGNIVALAADTCIKCHKCVEICPLNVFAAFEREGGTQILPLGEKNCIMCGKCEMECPADAIFINESFANGLRIMLREISSDKLQTAYWGKSRGK